MLRDMLNFLMIGRKSVPVCHSPLNTTGIEPTDLADIGNIETAGIDRGHPNPLY